LWDILHLSGGK